MKVSHLLLPILLILISCSTDDEYATINGKVQRALNGNGIADQSVIVMTRKFTGSGLFSSIKMLDSTKVVTDVNGNFSVALKNETDAFVTIVYQGDEDYSGSGIYTDYPFDKPLIIDVDKFIKFKINMTNINPYDKNDYIFIEFFSGLIQSTRTKIENFGVQNTFYPKENLPGGGSIGPGEEASWTGIDVNSIVYYSVPESAKDYKIRWYMTKNGIETDGFTNEIPYNINQVNPFSFEY